MKAPPQIPAGTSSLLSGASENLTFHKSPESFLASKILQHHKDHPEAVQKRTPVRAKILNRNVVILSSYHHIRQVLDPPDDREGKEPPYVAVQPYDDLMTPFFPPPNLLLSDGQAHHTAKSAWQPCSHALAGLATSQDLKTAIRNHISSIPPSQPFDLYNTLKELTWSISLSVFLSLPSSDPYFPKIVKEQEDLLRGQFSLLPVSVNVGVWSSPRKKGISARKDLQKLLEEVIATRRPSWLHDAGLASTRPPEEVVNHALMATSSLAVKALTSFLLAFLLNMFIYRPDQPEARSWSHAVEISTQEERQRRIDSVIQETLRLSPPIVGAMRRAASEQIITTEDPHEPDVLIPEGWDVWTYFPGANRDESIYGIQKDQELLRPIRFHDKIRPGHRLPRPFAFGAGAKSCLGEPFVKQLAESVYTVFAEMGLELQGRVEDKGVKGWLGWELASPEEWAKGVKQLPVQRPNEPVMVKLERMPFQFWKDEASGVQVTHVAK